MKKVSLSLCCIVSLLLSCLPTFNIKNVVPSSINYRIDTKSGKVTILLKDRRGAQDRMFTKMEAGLARYTITYENFDDPFVYLANNLNAEFSARGINVEMTVDSLKAHDLELGVLRYQAANRRVNGYTPWETTISFKGTMSVAGADVPITSIFYNGKVPFWSMSEVIDPCYNLTLSAIVKDVAAKINAATFKYATAEPELGRMIAVAREGAVKKNYQAILDLGGVNTRAAIATLSDIALKAQDQDARAYAFFALGCLATNDDLPGLAAFVNNYQDEGIDLYMAIKAIGDIHTPEATAFIAGLANHPLYDKEIGLRNVVNLYLSKQ